MAEQDDRQVSDRERLRDAFAQLLLAQGTAGAQKYLAGGSPEAVPMEAVWQAQARSQFPPSPSPAGVTRAPLFDRKDTLVTPLDIQRPQGYSIDNDVKAPTRFVDSADPNLRFPVQGEANRDNPAEAPFGGKGLVVGPYKPPEKKDKKKGKR